MRELLIGCLLFMFAPSWAASGLNDDPYEAFNRHMFAFNHKIDALILKPVSSIYHGVTPEPMQRGIHRAYLNIAELPSSVNYLAQGNSEKAGVSAFRFLINMTAGVFGLFDVATAIGMKKQPTQDTGLTFAKWGNHKSPYLVLPLLGPSTVRDAAGLPFDYITSIYPHIKSERLHNSLVSGGVIDTRTQLLPQEEVMKQASLDPYVFVRNAYLQSRNKKIRDNAGLPDPDPLDDYDNF